MHAHAAAVDGAHNSEIFRESRVASPGSAGMSSRKLHLLQTQRTGFLVEFCFFLEPTRAQVAAVHVSCSTCRYRTHGQHAIYNITRITRLPSIRQ